MGAGVEAEEALRMLGLYGRYPPLIGDGPGPLLLTKDGAGEERPRSEPGAGLERPPGNPVGVDRPLN